MRIRSPKDFWAGLIFIAIGAAFICSRASTGSAPCIAWVPPCSRSWSARCLAVLGAIIALRSFVLAGEPVPRFYARPIGVSLLAIVLFGVALQWLGLVAAVAVLVLVGAYAAREVRPLETVALAAVMIVFSVAVFVWLLGLPLPLWPGS